MLFVNPVTDGLHPFMPVGDLAEVRPCEIQQFIGITISGWAECSVAALPEARKPGLGIRLAPLIFRRRGYSD